MMKIFLKAIFMIILGSELAMVAAHEFDGGPMDDTKSKSGTIIDEDLKEQIESWVSGLRGAANATKDHRRLIDDNTGGWLNAHRCGCYYSIEGKSSLGRYLGAEGNDKHPAVTKTAVNAWEHWIIGWFDKDGYSRVVFYNLSRNAFLSARDDKSSVWTMKWVSDWELFNRYSTSGSYMGFESNAGHGHLCINSNGNPYLKSSSSGDDCLLRLNRLSRKCLCGKQPDWLPDYEGAGDCVGYWSDWGCDNP